jgi:hypothetical protein
LRYGSRRPGFQQFYVSKLAYRTKNFLSGVFAWAIADNAYLGANPMSAIKVGCHTNIQQEHAYTLEEVADMLE